MQCWDFMLVFRGVYIYIHHFGWHLNRWYCWVDIVWPQWNMNSHWVWFISQSESDQSLALFFIDIIGFTMSRLVSSHNRYVPIGWYHVCSVVWGKQQMDSRKMRLLTPRSEAYPKVGIGVVSVWCLSQCRLTLVWAHHIDSGIYTWTLASTTKACVAPAKCRILFSTPDEELVVAQLKAALNLYWKP